VSVALVASAASREVPRPHRSMSGAEWAAAITGGILIVVSYTLDAPRASPAVCPPYLWPVFAVGWSRRGAVADVLRREGQRRSRPRLPRDGRP
jgi:hypothetical protein